MTTHGSARAAGAKPLRRYDRDMAHATLVLSATPAFRLDLTVWALRRRRSNAVDRWNDGQYGRIAA
jgi:hypothetical protein